MSGVQYTEEQLNYFRACYLATSVIPDGLRTVFRNEWNKHFKASHGEWEDTAQNGNDFFRLESPKNQKLHKKDLSVMVKGDTKEWDCTRLFYAILYSNSVGKRLNHLVKKQINDLREFRNDVFAHSIDGQLTYTEFHAAIGKVETAFNNLNLSILLIDEVKNQKSFPTEELSKLKEELEKEKRRNQELPVLCTLPPKPSHRTIKRPIEVKRVIETLQRMKNANSNEVTVVYLSGNPGCGKSQVARQVGETFFTDGTDNKFVFTLDASTIDTFLQSYLELANLLRCDENRILWIETTKDLSKEEKLVKVKQLVTPRIEKYSSWLMILDNVSKLKSVIRYVPQAGDRTQAEGQMIITTQDSQCIPFDSHVFHLSLSRGLKEEDAVATLTEISGLAGEEEWKLKVAKALDFQPLALACAAVYMQRMRHSKPSWKDYVRLLEQGKRESTENVFMESCQSYPLTMSKAVVLAVTNAIETSKVMEHAFKFLSVIAPEPIALTHVIKYIKNCLKDEDDNVICSTICSSSLILCYEDETIRIHQVIHDHLLTRFQQEKTETKNQILFCSITSFSNLEFNINTRKTTSVFETRSTTSHLETFGRNLENNFEFVSADNFYLNTKNLKTLHHCLNSMALICREHGKHPTSKLYLKFLLTLEEKIYPEDHPEFAETLTNLGLVLGDLGQHQEARQYLERVLAIGGRLYDENHPNLATMLSNLGLVLQDLGQLQEAKQYFERALAIQEGIDDEKHPNLATYLSNLGQVLLSLGHHKEAKHYLERALVIQEGIYDQNHPNFATYLSNLGMVLRDLGQHKEAKHYLERVLAIQEEIYDENHPNLAITLSNLGLVLRDLGQHEEAKQYIEKALAIKERLYDENHPNLVTTLSNLGLVLRDLRQHKEAKHYLERALTIYGRLYDENHPNLATILSNLGMVLRDLRQHEEAKQYLKRALAIKERLYDENHPNLATILSNLGLVLRDLGQHEEAKQYLEKALAIEQKLYDENHPNVATTLSNLGLVLRDLGQHEEAKQYLEKALAIQERLYDENHINVATTLSNLGLIIQDLGQHAEAKQYLEKALAIEERLYDENHPKLATTLSNLGLVLRDLGQLEEAKQYIERALAIQEGIYDENHPNLATYLSNLGWPLDNTKKQSSI